MFALNQFASFLRRNKMRRDAMRDLRELSPEQLADIGIPSDRLGEVIEGLLARPEPFDLRARMKPEFDLRSFGQASPLIGRPL
jgi:hypothetical protein